jgi:hypothetical protein
MLQNLAFLYTPMVWQVTSYAYHIMLESHRFDISARQLRTLMGGVRLTDYTVVCGLLYNI